MSELHPTNISVTSPPPHGPRWPRLQHHMVLAAAAFLFGVWFWLHAPRMLEAGQDEGIRLTLGSLFALLILFRTKPEKTEGSLPRWLIPLFGVAGFVNTIGWGLIMHVHQLEWLGIMMIIYACLVWAFPRRAFQDVTRSMLLLYWLHPLPAQLFGWLQLVAQKASVRGSEWLCHMLNIRVWADGLVLRAAGAQTFEIPTWCSGMRTATTVFLLSLGLGILKRLRWHVTLAFMLAAVAQAIALNIVRISVMVLFAPAGAGPAGQQYLHNTANIIVVLTVFVVYAEMRYYEGWNRRRTSPDPDFSTAQEMIFSDRPPFWQFVAIRKGSLLLALTLMVLGLGLAFKSRVAHRADMYKSVVEELRDSGQLDQAERLAKHVADMLPEDVDWTLATLRILIMRQKYSEVIAWSVDVPSPDESISIQKRILRAYSFMGLGRMEEAAQVIRTLPEHIKRDNAMVAMILAELGHQADDPVEVANNIVAAAKWNPNTSRIHSLYPYLRNKRQWDAIINSDIGLPYSDPTTALAASEAYMNRNQAATVATLMRTSIERWPEDPRLLEPLFFLAGRGDMNWQQRYASHAIRCANATTNLDILAGMLDKCFMLKRPDLAWAICRRMDALDPGNPAALFCAARHGHEWMLMNRRFIGLNSPLPFDAIDISAYVRLAAVVDIWRPVFKGIPYAGELTTVDTLAARKELVRRAIEQFARRDKTDHLSIEMRYLYAHALEWSGDIDAAQRQLQRIVDIHPAEALRTRVTRSEIHARRNDWQAVYQALRDYPSETNANLNPLLRLSKAQMNLKMGLGAMRTARQTYEVFPDYIQSASAWAAALRIYDTPEEAVHILSQPRTWERSDAQVIEAQALFETERYREAESFCKSALLKAPPLDGIRDQKLVLPPAELSALWHRLWIPSSREFATNAVAARRVSATTTIPFVHDMLTRWLEAYDSGCASNTIDQARWIACGQTDTEKATALGQLAMLLCWKEKFVEARNVAGIAVGFAPDAPSLWRMLISLSGADRDVIREARLHCPFDGDIWLAELVARTQSSGSNAVDALPDQAAVLSYLNTSNGLLSTRFSAGAATRAADYLLRGHMYEAATLVANDAVARARGLLPAYVVGVKCAAAVTNRDMALECTRKAIAAALQPPPVFYEELVRLEGRPKTGGNPLGPDYVNALRNLRDANPTNVLWAEMLGYVRFRRGGWELTDALYQMRDVIDAGSTNRTPYLVAAEASRLLGNPQRAVDILRQGLQRCPDDPLIRNNLAYTLAEIPEGVAEALSMVPTLQAQATNDPAILDTIASIQIATRNGKAALETLNSLSTLADGNPNPAVRSRYLMRCALHGGRIALNEDRIEDAEQLANQGFRLAVNATDQDLLALTRLLTDTVNRQSSSLSGTQRPTQDESPDPPSSVPVTHTNTP